MCGIVGAVDLDGARAFDAAVLARMGAAIAHRGPDDHHVHVAPGVALGAQRLALVDPPNGRQPIADPSGRFVAVANGELYDHVAERARLAGRGARFRTRCDTEVWVHGFADEAAAYLARARGQFAVAVWDAAERRLVLARDRFGICPLYTARAGGWLLFASEIKALFASGMVDAALDPRGIDHVFACLCASPVRSAFAGVEPVPPGHAVTVHAGAVRRTRFATPVEFPIAGAERRGATRAARAAIVDELGATLDAAIARRLAADAPVATYLSAGVDSSLLVALAAKQRPGAITAFSVRLEGLGPDEADLAKATAAALGVEHVAVPIDAAGVAARFPAVVRAAEVPILDHADACLHALSAEVHARGFKAVLSGEGADEAFAGYPWTTMAHQLGGSVVLPAIAATLGVLVGGRDARLVAPGAFGATGAGRLYALVSRARGALYAPAFWERLAGWTPAADHDWEAERRVLGWDPLHRSLHADYECVLAGHLLLDKGDRVAMAHAIEPRFPYLDEAVVALAASLEPALKVRGRRDKWILRELAARHLPAAVARRKKQMFRAAPVIHGPDRPAWVDQLLSPPSLAKTGLFDPGKIATALAHRGGARPGPRAATIQGGLTAVVTTQLLAHLFCGGGLCDLRT
jgi:asparagine synthase (glutamine-hydrolysing)